MASSSNRRLRAVHKRHLKRERRLLDRHKALSESGRAKEAREVGAQLKEVYHDMATFRPRRGGIGPSTEGGKHPSGGVVSSQETRSAAMSAGFRAMYGRPQPHPVTGRVLGPAAPTSPVLEAEGPKVHGVNAQREERRRPKTGGAHGRNPGT